MRTEHLDQASFCPFAPREVSVLAELALGHLRYSLTDVPPQSNSPPGSVLEPDHAGVVTATSVSATSPTLHAWNETPCAPPMESTAHRFRPTETAPIAHDDETVAALRLGRSAEGRNAGPDSALAPREALEHRPGPAPAASASRPNPTRPGPQSQSLFRSYGSNLPTSLTYIILSTRGSSPWRPAADMGTNRRDISTYIPHLNFQGPQRVSGHRRKCGALRVPNHISLL
ncbi:hypothetical protein K1T71_012646 [Dendrolimus kikuchii]|uniref:Uncharacterized protein n=1 Tax=Dendrolimus kikuchii TaxID=765133 RepID=A0ACC1CK08_9NEOP|nr:hypothetical protein K1T71_012646 [Dendrolimus kikuchii]